MDRSSNAALYYDTSNFTTVNGVTTYVPGQSPTKFYDGAFDVLVSTTIVESGLDIPNANTLIVHRAGGWRHELDVHNRRSTQTWSGKPDVYHALQAALIEDLPLAPSFATALAAWR